MSERLQPGDPAPDFELPDADGKPISLAGHKGRKVIVYFYPAALTPGCTKQACDFTDNLGLLATAGYDVIGVSPDKPEKLAKFRDKENLSVTLVGDPGKEVSLADHKGRKVIVYFYPAALTPGCTKQACDFTDNLELLAGAGYDVIGISPDKPEKLAKFREAESLKVTLLADPEKQVLDAYGAYGEKKLYGKVVTGVIRSTIVVDEEGKVEQALYNVKATGHVAKIIKDLGI